MQSDEKQCIWCAETIKAAARICRFCNREQTERDEQEERVPIATIQRGPPPQEAYAPPAQSQPPQEQMLLNERGVWITTQRAHFDGKIYAVANITSVQTGVDDQRFGVWSFITLLSLLGAAFGISTSNGGCLASVVGIFVLLSLIIWLYPQNHWLKLATSGVESQALTSSDAAFVRRVFDALQQAMAMRRLPCVEADGLNVPHRAER